MRLKVGLVDFCDTTLAIASGKIVPAGLSLDVEVASPTDLFRRQAQHAEFDVAEMSISTFIAMLGRSDDRFVGLPVFPRRAFRHGFIFINTDSGVARPKDLEGRRVGVSEYQQTASLWIRGILRDEYGVDTDSIEWREGGVNEAAVPERYPVALPSRVRVSRIEEVESLDELLQRGDLDAVIGAQRPKSFDNGVPNIQRLFPGYREIEREYYQRTRFFPLMHLVVMRRSTYETAPEASRVLCDAFEKSKQASDERLLRIATRACALPWLQHDLEEIRSTFGGMDYRPYGVEANREMLQRMVAMSHRDGLT